MNKKCSDCIHCKVKPTVETVPAHYKGSIFYPLVQTKSIEIRCGTNFMGATPMFNTVDEFKQSTWNLVAELCVNENGGYESADDEDV